MMKNLLFVLASLFTLTATAQTIRVVDEINNTHVPYASAYLLIGNQVIAGVSCDKNGIATLPVKEFETLMISCIGYEDLTLKKSEIKDVIFVMPYIFQINEVAISNKKNVEIIGYKGKKGRDLGMLKDVEHIMYFENNKTKSLPIKSFSFKTKKTIVQNTLRIVMYEVTDKTHSKPGKNLLTEDIIFTLEPETEGTTTVNLSEYNIELPAEGAYVGIDIIDVRDSNGNYSYDKNHMNEYETIKSEAQIFLTNHKYERIKWENANWRWEQTFRTSNVSGKNNYFVIPDFSIQVYTD